MFNILFWNCFITQLLGSSFRSTPEKAKKKKGESETSVPGQTIVNKQQQFKIGTHVYLNDGAKDRFAGKIDTIDFESKSSVIFFYKWPTEKTGVWRMDEKFKWRVEFEDIISILEDPFVSDITKFRKGFYFRELAHLL